jgi:hypothetical protein
VHEDANRFRVLAAKRQSVALRAQQVHVQCARAVRSALAGQSARQARIAGLEAGAPEGGVDLAREQRRQQHLTRLRVELVAHNQHLAACHARAQAAHQAFSRAQTAYEQIKVLHERALAKAALALRRRRLRLEEEEANRPRGPKF